MKDYVNLYDKEWLDWLERAYNHKEPKKHRRNIPTSVKRAVYERDKHRCVNCGKTCRLNLHHIQYYSDGGADTIDNLVVLCDRCHYEVHKDEKVSKIMRKG